MSSSNKDLSNYVFHIPGGKKTSLVNASSNTMPNPVQTEDVEEEELVLSSVKDDWLVVFLYIHSWSVDGIR